LSFVQRILKTEKNLTEECTPWFYPIVGNEFRMCDPFQMIQE
jgi:hypothetical protein